MKLLPALVASTAIGANTSSKPNIVYIMTDDQGFSDVSWKNRHVKSPNLDMLRKRGLTIDGGYSQSRCTPSRVSFMTGKYPHNTGLYHVVDTVNAAGLPLSETLLPEHLKQAGYDTHFIGKWHLGYCHEALRPHNRGFDTAYGFMGAAINYYRHTSTVQDYWYNDEKVENKNYCTDDFVDEALRIVDRRLQTNDKDPFFTWLSFNVPHAQIQAPSDGSAHVASFSDVEPASRRDYLAALWQMDKQVGRLVDKLKSSNEYDNTIFVFQSDNGPTRDGYAYPLRGVKGTPMEGGQRVPSFIAGPGIRPGTLDRSSFMHISDWAPTLLDFAGFDLSRADFDGHSFKNVFTNANANSPRDDMFYFLNSVPVQGVYRQGKYKFVWKVDRHYKSATQGIHIEPAEGICTYHGIAEEGNFSFDDIAAKGRNLQIARLRGGSEGYLFDLDSDPYEMENIYNESQHGDMVDGFIKLIQENAARAGEVGKLSVNAKGNTNSAQHPKKTGWTTSGWCSLEELIP